MKNIRQQRIMEIINGEDIETQGQLLKSLEAVGIRSTQATISRDIKELRLIKELSPAGVYRYAATEDDDEGHAEKLMKIFRECVTSVIRAQNIVVIKTLPGLASAACSAIDQMDVPEVAGTLAGDDTGFIVLTDSEAAETLSLEIRSSI